MPLAPETDPGAEHDDPDDLGPVDDSSDPRWRGPCWECSGSGTVVGTDGRHTPRGYALRLEPCPSCTVITDIPPDLMEDPPA